MDHLAQWCADNADTLQQELFLQTTPPSLTAREQDEYARTPQHQDDAMETPGAQPLSPTIPSPDA